jgi:hypothetical protein
LGAALADQPCSLFGFVHLRHLLGELTSSIPLWCHPECVHLRLID